MSIKIDVISGFLGAGKTTMINKLLGEGVLGDGIAIIENDFGDINIDAGRIQESGVEIKSLSSGCICCTLSGDFHTALLELIKEYNPKRIIIEPTGVGRLSDVIGVINRVKKTEAVELNISMTVVDVVEFEDFIEVFGDFFKDQIQNANIIALSKSQLTDQVSVNNVISSIREINPKANIVATPWDELESKDILNVTGLEERCNHGGHDHICSCHEHKCHEQDCHDHHHDDHTCHDHNCNGHHHHHEDSVEESMEYLSIETMKMFSKDKLEAILDSLKDPIYGKVFRAKGSIINEDRRWLDFDFLPKAFEIKEGKAKTIGQGTVIGRNLNKEAIRNLFD